MFKGYKTPQKLTAREKTDDAEKDNNDDDEDDDEDEDDEVGWWWVGPANWLKIKWLKSWLRDWQSVAQGQARNKGCTTQFPVANSGRGWGAAGERGRKGGSPVGRQIFDVCLFIFTKRNEWETVDIGRERKRERVKGQRACTGDQISDFFFWGRASVLCCFII